MACLGIFNSLSALAIHSSFSSGTGSLPLDAFDSRHSHALLDAHDHRTLVSCRDLKGSKKCGMIIRGANIAKRH